MILKLGTRNVPVSFWLKQLASHIESLDSVRYESHACRRWRVRIAGDSGVSEHGE